MQNYTQKDFEVIDRYNTFIGNIDGFAFMNDGYVDIDQHGFPVASTDIELTEKFQPWRYQAQLYKKCLDVALIDRLAEQGTLLDLSCGKGGGLAFLKDYYRFQKLIGVDLNPTHIEICKRNIKDVEFLAASAIEIPLKNETVDIITSVEAAAYYQPFEQYLSEAYRLLAPGGLLVQANPDAVDINLYADQGFKIESRKNITRNVRIACAISKYIMRDIDRSDTLFDCLMGDETRYIYNRALYNIMVFSK
jgi:SAM-dependent methyltransferase